MVEHLLRYDQVDISYRGELAVKQVSFAVDPGEILGIVGESGSGKSTLIKAAMGLLSQEGLVTRGDIWYQGKNITDLPGRDRRRLNGPELGYIFQNAGSSFCTDSHGGSPVIRNDEGTQPDIEKRISGQGTGTAGKAWFFGWHENLKKLSFRAFRRYAAKGRNCRSDAFKSSGSFWRMSRLRRWMFRYRSRW